jgi:protein-S-isoprenylcysteine O-methyltransferase Ste14
METAWYLRLFYMPIVNFLVSWLLAMIIKAKRMGAPEMSRPLTIVSMIGLIGWCVLLWFVPFHINAAFWIGISIVVFGHVVFTLGYSAMREHPEHEEVVVDWGIYRISRHSHIMAGMITLFGTIVMGWNPRSPLYVIVWAYFVLTVILNHYAIQYEEKINIEKFGQQYTAYMKRTPRYLGIPKSQ